jgi:hypothetical protein
MKLSATGVGKVAVVAAVVATVTLASAGLAAAAVSGDFTATYDGWDDGESSDVRGHEIAVQGQIEVTGDAAVDPRIVVRGADSTVLDTRTVQIFVEGDQSIQFQRSFEPSQVVFTADEIPAGTTLRLEFVTYYVGGANSNQVPAGVVQVNFDQPGGDRTREEFTVQSTLENRPESVIRNANTGSQLSTLQEVLSYVGAGGLVLLLLALVAMALDDSGPEV